MRLFVASAACACLLCVACNSPTPRLNAPPHGTAEQVNDLQSTMVYMTDNALLADMTVSDVHFFPHRSLLNSLGEQRLSRLASLIDAYGGEIRFSTNSQDKQLVSQRTQAIKEYLRDAGVDVVANTVREDMPGGSGMDANEVVLIKLSEAAYIPGKSGTSGNQSSSSEQN